MHGSLPRGGAEELRYILLKGINRDRFSPFVCCIKEKGAVGRRIEGLGVPVIELGLSENMYDIRALPALFNLIKGRGFHIVQSCMFIATMFATLPAKISGVPVILSEEHCLEVWKKGHHKFIDRAVFSLVDRVIAVSEEVKKYMMRNEGVSGDKIAVLPNTADQERFKDLSAAKDLRSELNIDSASPVIGIIGRLHPQKGHKFLFDSLIRIKEVFPYVKVLVAGEGPLERELKDYIKKMQLENNVIFLGSYEDTPAIFKAIDLLAVSSLYEGQSVVILEAMAGAKPVVATNVGGTPELIENEKTGILIESSNACALSNAIIKLLKDKERARHLGLAAQEMFFKQFSPDAYVQRMENLYSKLLDGKKSDEIKK